MFFFFQAEDGIRDRTVTGVQTCALPIWQVTRREVERLRERRVGLDRVAEDVDRHFGSNRERRSEERRVGKECRSRWAPDHEKKKNQKHRVNIIEDKNTELTCTL